MGPEGGPTLLLAPLVGLWPHASLASNRVFLEAMTSGELGRSVSDAFTARTSWELYTMKKNQTQRLIG